MSYEEQIMSKDKYSSKFSPQMEAIVFIILQIFFATRAIFKIGEYLTIRLRARVFYDQIVEKERRKELFYYVTSGSNVTRDVH